MDTSAFEPPSDAHAALMSLIRRQAGINLEDDQRPLVESRLAERLRLLSCDLAGYLRLLASDRTELVVCIHLLTTSHTQWLRDPAQFADFEGRVLSAAGRNGRHMRVWCAAATSEEPYSIALCLLRTLGDLRGWDCSVLATDISNRALARASDGLFADTALAPLSRLDRQLAVELATTGPPPVWRVKPALKRLVDLARLNLIEDNWPMHGPFNAIFCRNIICYLDPSGQQRLLHRFIDLLVRGGTLYLGQDEAMASPPPTLRQLAPGIYSKD